MPPRYPVNQLYPEQTRIEPIALDALNSSVVQVGLNYWCELRGERRYPRREELSPREIACALSNMVLVDVVRGVPIFNFGSWATKCAVPIPHVSTIGS